MKAKDYKTNEDVKCQKCGSRDNLKEAYFFPSDEEKNPNIILFCQPCIKQVEKQFLTLGRYE